MKRKQIIILFTLIVLSIFIVGNTFADEISDREYAQKTLDQINDYNKRGVQDSLLILSKELLLYSRKQQFPYFEGEACKRIGGYYNYFNRNGDSLRRYYQIASEAYSRIGDTNNQAIMLVQVALNLNNLGKREESLEIYLQSKDLLETIDNSLWCGIANNHIGQIYFYKGNYYLALKYIHNAINFFKKCEDYRNVGTSVKSSVI